MKLSTSETSKKLNQLEFLERSVRMMKLSLFFDPYLWFCGILSQYLNTAARWACFQGFRKWSLSVLRSFFWYCSLHIHFYNFHFPGWNECRAQPWCCFVNWQRWWYWWERDRAWCSRAPWWFLTQPTTFKRPIKMCTSFISLSYQPCSMRKVQGMVDKPLT